MFKKHLPIFLFSIFAIISVYTVSRQAALTQSAFFSTAVPNEIFASKPYVIAAVGDMVCPPGKTKTEDKCQAELVATAIKKREPKAILLLGDLQYEDGEEADFKQAFEKIWGDLIPISYPVPGNHEYHTDEAEGYFNFFGARAGERSKGYYGFNLGPWRLIGLNTNCKDIGGCGLGSAQAAWLADDLSTKPRKCTLAFWHHPVFSSGKYLNDADSKGRGKTFWQMLYDNQAEIVLAAHDHLYERFEPQNVDAQINTQRGIRQFVVGTGGRSLYPLDSTKDLNHSFGQDSEFGFLELNLWPSSYTWQYINTRGDVLDKGSESCH